MEGRGQIAGRESNGEWMYKWIHRSLMGNVDNKKQESRMMRQRRDAPFTNVFLVKCQLDAVIQEYTQNSAKLTPAASLSFLTVPNPK
jgi:hypothetical protein